MHNGLTYQSKPERLQWLKYLRSITLRSNHVFQNIEILSTMKWFLYVGNIHDTRELRALINFAHFYLASNFCRNVTPCHYRVCTLRKYHE